MVNRLATDMPYMRASGEFSIRNLTNDVNLSVYEMADVPGFEPGSPA